MTTPVIQHVALSVHDIDKSADWYARLFDMTLVAEFDEPAPMKIFMTPTGQAIDLRQDPEVADEEFTQTRVGWTTSGSSARAAASSTAGSIACARTA